MSHTTNRKGFSACWMRAVQASDSEYDKVGDYSITELIGPVRERMLRKRHDDEITEDVADRMWILLGHAVHYVLDRAKDADSLTEQRIVLQVAGREIAFKPDRVEPISHTEPPQFHLKDFKITSVYAVKKGPKDDWVKQCNGYAWALSEIGIPVAQASIETFLRDWSAAELARDTFGDYPDDKIQVLGIELWPHEEAGRYIEDRVKLFVSCENMPDDELPFCTEEERWARAGEFAAIKPGNKRASKRERTKGAIQAWVDKQKDPSLFRIEYRPGKSTRCEGYCPAKPFCNQYRDHIAKEEN